MGISTAWKSRPRWTIAAAALIPERLGFREEGVRREAERIGERYNDLAVYAMLAPEWVQEERT